MHLVYAASQPATSAGPSRRVVARDGKEMVHVPPGMFHYGADYHQVCTGEYYIDNRPGRKVWKGGATSLGPE